MAWSNSLAKAADTNLHLEQKAIDEADIVIVGDNAVGSLPSNVIQSFISPGVSYGLSLFVHPIQQMQQSLVFADVFQEDTYFATLFATMNAQLAYQTLKYAKQQGKKTIFISLRAPYNLPSYKEVADAMLAVYNPGYLEGDGKSYYCGPMMPAVARVLFHMSKATGVLPVNIPNPDNSHEIVYSRGFGIRLN